ncbi:MAG TPA: isoprenyl transferase [Deltaproteobacteria bacterium]|mgnify:CR=1 FL=1|nr:isoprenyl transferase [Deltaproteobacteria bacterium]HCP46080.1 isoprenyl transferase [Deltaproteobacteria bacterium]
MGPGTSAVPRHIAIIMDGNGRWARSRGLARVQGHAEGVNSVRTVTRACRRLGVQALTLYSFSTENWGRPDGEVSALMELLAHYLEAERDEILSNGIRLTHCGEIERLPDGVQKLLLDLEEQSKDGDGMVLNLALSYGARQEILRAVRMLAAEVKSERITLDEIDEDLLSSSLYTAELPDPDLVIRTGGESRLSNFLLWQVAYSEFYVTTTSWPDFREPDLQLALDDFRGRQRRYGLTGQQVGS